jgi:hypothetical protein
MTKKTQEITNKRAFSYRLMMYLGLWGVLAICVWWIWDKSTDMRDLVYQYVENGEILTLESKFTPEDIMEAHRGELVGSDKRSYQEPSYKYSPYLLLEIKYYGDDKKSREGVILWGLENGEIVLNTESWETTHGFKDCLDCEANRNDFKMIYALAKQGGILSLDDLQRKLNVEREILANWIQSAKDKHLIVQKENFVQLHFENPKILVFPQTQFKQQLVSKPISSYQRSSKKYSRHQIVKIAQAAFGNEFTIRSEKEIFLPIYSLSVLNADGSIHMSDWNAINGNRILPTYLTPPVKNKSN